MADFSEILQEAEKLTTDIEGTSDLPKVDRSLHQVLEASKELYSRVTQTGAKDLQANLLLGSKGVDLPKIAQKLETLSTKRTFEPIETTDERDVATCLTNQIRNCIFNVIEKEHEDSMQTVYKDSWAHQLGEWKQEKRKILNALLAPSGAFVEAVKTPSMFISPASVKTSNLNYHEGVYAAKVIEYNKNSGRALQKPNLINIFRQAAEEFKDTKVNDMWEVLYYMTQLPPFPIDEDPIKVRYSKIHIELLQKQGRKYLEDRYKTYMTNIINENLLHAARGGVPGTYHLVRSFVSIRLVGDYLGLQDGTIEGRPLWPMVYFCLRSGDINATLYCIKSSGSVDCKDIIALLEAKLNNLETAEISKLESNIRFQYRRFVRNSTDPFKRIVWSVLGCCDVLDEHSEVVKTVDDYLWLKLSLVRVNYDKEDHVNYADFQRTIIEDYGESHYDAFAQPHLYFQVLVLTGQFESALEFLFRIEKFKVHASHMAIGLNEIYLLAVPRDVASPLICVDPLDPKPARRLNVARLTIIYARKFQVNCPSEAIQYYYLLRNLKNSEGINLFLECVKDLVVETMEFEKILGGIQKNGIRSRGLIDQFESSPVSAEEIAKAAAENLVLKGLFLEAVILYDIANDQEKVLNLYSTLMSQVVELPTQPGSVREKICSRIYEISERYEREGFKCSTATVMSFNILKELLLFFDYYHAKEYNAAMKVLSDLKIIPFHEEELPEFVKNFKRFHMELSKVIPSVLLAAMNILLDQYNKLKSAEMIPSNFREGGTDRQLNFIQTRAKVLTNFGGMLPYRLPGDINSRLIQMEIMMH